MATRNFSFSGTAAAASTPVICTIPVGQGGQQRMGIQVTNGGAAALDAFLLEVEAGNSGVWSTLAGPTTASDFSSPVAPLIRVVGAPVTLAAAATALLLLDTHGLSGVRISASGNAAACAITVKASVG